MGGYVPPNKQVYRTELYENLSQVAGTTRLEFLHLLRHLPEVWWWSNPSGRVANPTKRLLRFYTKQIPRAWNTGQPEDFYTRIPFRFSNAYSMSMFNWFHLFPHHFLTLAHRTKHYPLESFLFNILIHIFFCFSSGNKSNWDRSKEQSTLVTMPRKFSTGDSCYTTDQTLASKKKLIEKKIKKNPSKSHFV